MIARRYKKHQKPSEPEADQGDYPFEAFFGEHIVVLLGDAGLGKSKSFEMAAAVEPGAELVSVAKFLRTDVERYRGKVLYLDGLDEQRARSEGQLVLDTIVSRLDVLGSPKVRVSCRTTDWLDGSDIQMLKDVCPSGEIRQLSLQPLNDLEIAKLVSLRVGEPQGFIDSARQHGVYELLQNPETLNLVADAVSGGRGWPKTRREVFEQAYEFLVHEQNTDHQLTEESIAEEELKEAAEYLAAVCLLSGSEGIALLKRHEVPNFPAIQRLGRNPKVLLTAAKRRVFRSIEGGKITYRHRMVGEFLTAKYLARRIAVGHPVSRVLALITGADGGTLSDLRGIYGWLVTLAPGFAADIVPRDPYGAILYGDPASWNLGTCRAALKALGNLADVNPWFRGRGWGSRPLAGFGRRGLAEDFKALLDRRSQSHLGITILSILSAAGPFPEMKEFLLNFIQNANQISHLRDDAVRAFMSCCPESSGELVAVLDGIQAGTITDPDNLIEIEIIRSLYPEHLTVRQVAPRLLGLRNGKADASYYLTHNFMKLTPAQDLMVLADILGEARSGEQHWSFAWQRFVEELLWRVLNDNIDTETPERIYHWLGMALGGADYNIVQGNRTQRIPELIGARPELYRAMFEIMLAQPFVDIAKFRRRQYQFVNRTFRMLPPAGFRRYLLERVATIENDEAAIDLFGTAILPVFNPSGPQELTIEEVFTFVEQHPRFQEELERHAFCSMNSWQMEEAKRKRKSARRKCVTRLKHKRDFEYRVEGIRNGIDVAALRYFAEVRAGRSNIVDQELSPDERIVDLVGPDIAAAVMEGFVAAVDRFENSPTPRDIFALRADNKSFHMQEVMPEGLLIIRQVGRNISALDHRILKAAIAFHLLRGSEEEQELIAEILAAQPHLGIEVLRDHWWYHLEKGNGAAVESYYLLGSKSIFTEAARSLALDVLRDFPGADIGLIEPCLVVGLADNRTELLRLLPDISTTGLPPKNQFLFAIAAYVLRPDDFATRIEPLVDSVGAAMALVQFIFKFEDEVKSRNWAPPLERVAIMRAATRHLGVVYPSADYQSGDGLLRSASSYLRDMLSSISNEPAPEVTDALEKMVVAEPETGWRSEFVQALADQRKNRREFEFKYSTVEQLVRALTTDRPANVADMREIVVHALDDIAEAARNGATDDWKSFWNLDRYGRPGKPRVENICRDEIMRHLKVALRHLGIAFASEGRYAEENRSDIDCRYELGRVPIELKRSQHPEVWKAAENQLVTEYCRDPETAGLGIYLVLWFGAECTTKKIDGTAKPTSATEMQVQLQNALPSQLQYRVVVRCLDVSRPAGQSVKRPKAGKKTSVAKSRKAIKPKTKATSVAKRISSARQK
ncbi:MAG: hypothetical protein KBC46_01420 [Ferrovibrio sp.]|nr:hypothetical protein [Ferrovibrio sp.]